MQNQCGIVFLIASAVDESDGPFAAFLLEQQDFFPMGAKLLAVAGLEFLPAAALYEFGLALP